MIACGRYSCFNALTAPTRYYVKKHQLMNIIKMPSIAGKYENYKAEDDVDEHLAAAGVSFVGRKMFSITSPTMEIIINGDTMTIKIVTLLSTKEISFNLGQEYEELLPDGTKMKSITTIVNDHELVTTSTIVDTGVKTTRHLLFTDDECIVTLTTDGVEKAGKRYYKRIN